MKKATGRSAEWAPPRSCSAYAKLSRWATVRATSRLPCSHLRGQRRPARRLRASRSLLILDSQVLSSEEGEQSGMSHVEAQARMPLQREAWWGMAWKLVIPIARFRIRLPVSMLLPSIPRLIAACPRMLHTEKRSPRARRSTLRHAETKSGGST